MLKRLGYKKGDILKFNRKRICGLWLLIIGTVIALSTLLGGRFYLNPIVFMIGYGIGFYVAFLNRAVNTSLTDGESSAFQNRVAGIGIIGLFILIFLLGGSCIPTWNWRMIWLGVLLATGLHFFPFYFVHGKTMIFIGLLCSLSAIIGMVFSSIPFCYFPYTDAIIKMFFGVYLLFFSKPTTSQKHRAYMGYQ